ncbi:hypothetical protein RJT34_18533 [Clitoria ternatea]|uniref:Uncharacterized protein n=1 Tax=Clitoria ternatea TaxID=43366 RepID=A0AAN9PFX9_CLITE
MVPSQNGKQENSNNNRSGSDYVFYSTTSGGNSAMNQVVEGSFNCLLGSDNFVAVRGRQRMAEPEQSPTPNTATTTTHHHNNELGGTSTSKGEEQEQQEGPNNNNNNNWLQLSIGITTTKQDHDGANIIPTTHGSGLVELDLLPSRRSLEQQQPPPPAIFPARGGRGGGGGSSSFGGSLLFEQSTSSSMCVSMASGPLTSTFGHHNPQEMMNWAFGPLLPHSMPIMPSSSSCTSFSPLLLPPNSSSSSSSSHSSSLRPPLGSYFPTPFHHFPSSSSSPGFDQFDVAAAGPSSDVTVRVVDPPRRPHSGIWFMLQASQNPAKEPLPQIPKNYLRIKDGRMTVRLLLKYLVSKLRLESESEIEITCKGQQLLPFLTLQHVRDNIWSPRDTTRALLSDSSTMDHVMVLHYGRSTS